MKHIAKQFEIAECEPLFSLTGEVAVEVKPASVKAKDRSTMELPFWNGYTPSMVAAEVEGGGM